MITSSPDGTSTGFQHGRDGVFIRDGETGRLERIFTPDEDVLATSTPLWSPDGGRVIFTTAVAADGTEPVLAPGEWDDFPEGRIFWQQPVRYTCWLRDNAAPEPVPLFEASCDHVGYVAANLAVRWHPTGNAVVYLDRAGEAVYGVFQYDIASRQSRQIFPHASEAVLFDWTPDGSRLVCLLGNYDPSNRYSGIWIGRPGDEDWWQVPESPMAAATEGNALLEHLRRLRPAWTPDGQTYAFVATRDENGADRHRLYRGRLAGRKVELLEEFDSPARDLRWSPDGNTLGLIRGTHPPSLHVLDPETKAFRQVSRMPVRRFAGWNRTGERLAYVVPDRAPLTGSEGWAFLIFPIRRARDILYVGDGNCGTPGDIVFSGMRITFPTWSNHPDRLTFWATFGPTHRSWWSLLFPSGLRPGDPAVVLDIVSGELEWMPVNAHERAQVGHYYLLNGDYAEARRWYEEAAREFPRTEPLSIGTFFEPRRGVREFGFFHYYCLAKLGLREEAQAKLEEFRQASMPVVPTDVARMTPGEKLLFADPSNHELVRLLFRLATDFYMGEVFLSLEAPEDGRAFFESALQQAESDVDRLSSAIVLGQLYLLEGEHGRYAELATTTIAPLLVGFWGDRELAVPRANPHGQSRPERLLVSVAGLSLLPMYAAEFLAGLPRDQLQGLVPRWEHLQAASRSDVTRFAADLFLCEAYRQLGHDADRKLATDRIERNPARRELLPEGGTAQVIRELGEWTGTGREAERSGLSSERRVQIQGSKLQKKR